MPRMWFDRKVRVARRYRETEYLPFSQRRWSVGVRALCDRRSRSCAGVGRARGTHPVVGTNGDSLHLLLSRNSIGSVVWPPRAGDTRNRFEHTSR